MQELLVGTVFFILVRTGANAACYVQNCITSDCSGYNCGSCKDGYYLIWSHNRNYCNPCMNSYCEKCTKHDLCTLCNSGRYGNQCQRDCSECKNQECNGTECTYGCQDGRYLTSGKLCNICPSYCSKCSSNTKCTECKNAKRWGQLCYDYCYYCSGNCDINSGCSACNSGYFIQYNSTKGGSECTKCPNNCYSCSSDTYCYVCSVGYWGNYCQHSCEHCIPKACSKYNGCNNGCVSGYFQRLTREQYFCDKCPDHCSVCSSLSICSSCENGFAGSVCQFDCRTCNGWLCSDVNGACSINCRSDQFYEQSSQSCQQCPNGCMNCTDTNHCDSCTKGKWGSYCQNNCSITCYDRDCKKGSGRCYKCIDHFYGSKCSSECMDVCKTCLDGISCETCNDGLFSSDSSNQCNCDTASCLSRTDTNCLQCPSQKLYPWENGCCPCSTTCKDNYCYTNQTCLNCVDKKHGQDCKSDCSMNCKDRLCYRDGRCISCIDRKYGVRCQYWCSNVISYCNRCYVDSNNGPFCNRCNEGRYVKNNQCVGCSNACYYKWPVCNSTTGACLYGCKPDWYGEFCDSPCNISKCQTCRDNVNICEECQSGFYLEGTSSCVACPDNCKIVSQCNKLNGSCDDGCLDSWTGPFCNETCYHACSRCAQYDSNNCDECKIGFYGGGCESNCSQQCKVSEGQQICNKTDGYCSHGCANAFWGDTCELPCGIGCNGSVCNRTDGRCLNRCIDTYYGDECGLMCSNNCDGNGNISVGRLCNEVSGRCFYTCRRGWHGETCEGECSKTCKNNECYRNNGTCTLGCNEGYTGLTCMQALRPGERQGSNAAAIGGGAGAGVAVVVIIVIVVVFVVLRKRKTSSRMDTKDGAFGRKQQNSKQLDPGAEYSNIIEARTEKQETQIPGGSNLLYANVPVRMSDVSEKEEQINGNTIPARPTSEDYLKEEEIDEDDIHVVGSEEPDASGEADNTYYNIGGKRVAVAKLAEYIKHKTQGELCNDFEKLPKGLLKSYKEAKKPKNATKNKYRAVYPYDENRVVLLDGGSDYMNASYIDGYNRSKEYIASSGPFKKSYDTTLDFWRMIWQERCETLVMLTKPVEKGQTKCMKYWSEAGESCKFGDIHITCLTEDPYADFTIRILAVTKGGESMNVRHVHFTAWPDKGIPHDVTSMIELRQKVRSLHKDKDSPMIVHCSAGIGRTGTFIVLDMLTYEGEYRGSVDIFGSVVGLRYQRCNMVQTPEQYVYLHHAVLHSLTFDCRSIPGDMFLQTYNKLIERNGGERTIDKQFQQLQSISEEMTDEDRAQIERNKALSNKNRKGADIPADENRVRLHENRKPGASDYINAVFINSFRKRRKFIVAQTPLPSTVVDFLSLIHQEKCTCVVSMEEPDIQDKTVKVYWPADNQVLKHGVFKVCCKDSKTTNHCVTKKLCITYHGPNGEESRDVNLFIFTNWSKDSPVPKTSDSLLDLVKTVDVMNRKSETEPPILIHCRTGAERSCLYCAVSVLIEKMEIEHEVSVVNTLRQIKARRILAMSSVEQYKFCHQAVISYLQSFDIYSNFGLKEAEA